MKRAWLVCLLLCVPALAALAGPAPDGGTVAAQVGAAPAVPAPPAERRFWGEVGVRRARKAKIQFFNLTDYTIDMHVGHGANGELKYVGTIQPHGTLAVLRAPGKYRFYGVTPDEQATWGPQKLTLKRRGSRWDLT